MPKYTATVTIGPIDIDMLRGQRDFLLDHYWGEGPADRPNDGFEFVPHEIEGLINLLDSMLDEAEGFVLPTPTTKKDN